MAWINLAELCPGLMLAQIMVWRVGLARRVDIIYLLWCICQSRRHSYNDKTSWEAKTCIFYWEQLMDDFFYEKHMLALLLFQGKECTLLSKLHQKTGLVDLLLDLFFHRLVIICSMKSLWFKKQLPLDVIIVLLPIWSYQHKVPHIVWTYPCCQERKWSASVVFSAEKATCCPFTYVKLVWSEHTPMFYLWYSQWNMLLLYQG